VIKRHKQVKRIDFEETYALVGSLPPSDTYSAYLSNLIKNLPLGCSHGVSSIQRSIAISTWNY
jgi:hypothetical protein